MIVRFPVDISKLIRYLHDKRQSTDVEVTMTHVATKACGLALRDVAQLNGHVILGGFYPTEDINISVNLNDPRSEKTGQGAAGGGGEGVLVKIDMAHRKPVEFIADEMQKKARAIREGKDEIYEQRKKVLQSIPNAFAANIVETLLSFMGGQLGVSVPKLGVTPYPLGSVTIVTAPASDGNDMEVDMTIVPTKRNASCPITITIGGTRVLTKLDSDNKMSASHVLSVSATIDCRTGTLAQGRQFCQKLQEYLNNPQLLDKEDRKAVLAYEEEQRAKARAATAAMASQ